MERVHPVNQTLLAILENQVARTAAAFEGLTEADLDAAPGGDCHSIRGIAKHLSGLRQFQLTLLGSPLAAEIPAVPATASVAEILEHLSVTTGLLRRAIEAHDAEDWYVIPPAPRSGPWGAEATLARFTRPFNDFTNHLGAVRAIRRIRGNPAARTQ